jgi:hypothetical protein
MRVLRPGALIGAFLITSPSLWDAATGGGMTFDAAILRFLIAVLPCGVALALLDALLDAYVSGVGRGGSGSDGTSSGETPGRRRSDSPRSDQEAGTGV